MRNVAVNDVIADRMLVDQPNIGVSQDVIFGRVMGGTNNPNTEFSNSYPGESIESLNKKLKSANIFHADMTRYAYDDLKESQALEINKGELHLPGMKPVMVDVTLRVMAINSNPTAVEPVFSVFLSNGEFFGTYFSRAFRCFVVGNNK